MANKWIIVDNQLRLSACVDYHRNLLSSKHLQELALSKQENRNPQFQIGGGMWWVSEEKKTFYFYGHSHDFGKVTKEQFEKAEYPLSLDNYTLVFTLEEDFVALMMGTLEPELIIQPRG